MLGRIGGRALARGERDGIVGGLEVQRHGADRRGGAVLDGQRELIAVAAEVEVRVSPRVKFAGAAERLTGAHLGDALARVVHKHDGDVVVGGREEARKSAPAARARHRREVVVAGALEDLRVEPDVLANALDDDALEVVVEDPARDPERLEREGVPEEERLERLVEGEARVHRARPRQHQHEARQRAGRGADLDLPKSHMWFPEHIWSPDEVDDFLVDFDPDLDWACLRVEAEPFADVPVCRIGDGASLATRDPWSTYGVPDGAHNDGASPRSGGPASCAAETGCAGRAPAPRPSSPRWPGAASRSPTARAARDRRAVAPPLTVVAVAPLVARCGTITSVASGRRGLVPRTIVSPPRRLVKTAPYTPTGWLTIGHSSTLLNTGINVLVAADHLPGGRKDDMSKGHSNSRANANNRSNQMNPNNAAYWSSRGLPSPATEGAAPTASTPPAAPTATEPAKK